MSDSRAAADKILQSVLAKLEHLNLRRAVFDIHPFKSNAGGSCDVYRGKLSKGDATTVDVAVKRVRASMNRNLEFAKAFVKEMNTWEKLVQPNIVSLEGYILEDGFPAIVSAWAEGGTVVEYLKIHIGCDELKIVLGIANGLAYLHSNGIIHADLKGENILMNHSGVPMLTDFGQSRVSNYSMSALKTTAYDNVKGTAHWMAYELLGFIDSADSQVICTKESDMWAFGMVIYEIISGQLPYAHVTRDSAHMHVSIASFIIMQAIRNKQLPEKPSLNSIEREMLWKLSAACWDYTPADRITVGQIIATLVDATTGQSVDSTESAISSRSDSTIAMVEDVIGEPSLGKGTEGVIAGARQLDRYTQIGEKYHLLLERMEKIRRGVAFGPRINSSHHTGVAITQDDAAITQDASSTSSESKVSGSVKNTESAIHTGVQHESVSDIPLRNSPMAQQKMGISLVIASDLKSRPWGRSINWDLSVRRPIRAIFGNVSKRALASSPFSPPLSRMRLILDLNYSWVFDITASPSRGDFTQQTLFDAITTLMQMRYVPLAFWTRASAEEKEKILHAMRMRTRRPLPTSHRHKTPKARGELIEEAVLEGARQGYTNLLVVDLLCDRVMFFGLEFVKGPCEFLLKTAPRKK